MEEVYRCRRCGAVCTIAWRSEMEEAVDQLATSFLQDDSEAKHTSDEAGFCQAVVYEDIETIMRMKRDYETHTLFRSFQGFDRDYLQKLVLVWVGSKGRIPYSTDSLLR
jgi:hypothetical protein